MSTAAPVATPKKGRIRKPPASEAHPAPTQPDPPAGCSESILSQLGLQGLDELEPVILAALVTEDPLLLVGPHGTGKSMLLERLAAALKLDFRHYNASLICFDDLIGFPVPDSDSAALKYLQTPATIWDAEAVFFDEVSRCKPDVQNKLFSILHERKVQGLSLSRLRYRWSAMNPPAGATTQNYAGSLPLDSALADRYAFIVEMPDWKSLSDRAQEIVLSRAGATPDASASARLQDILERARPLWRSCDEQLRPLLTPYLRILAALLEEAEIRLSIRRLVMLTRNIPAVHAVRQVLSGGWAEPEESAWVALSCSVPHPAEGQVLPRAKLRAAHAQAWKSATEGNPSLLIGILTEKDPIARLAAALRSDELNLQQRSIIVADCLQLLPEGARVRAAMWIMENNLAGRLVAAVAERVAEDYAIVAASEPVSFKYYSDGPSQAERTLQPFLAGLTEDDREDTALARYLISSLASNDGVYKDFQKLIHQWRDAQARLSRVEQKSA